MQAARGRSSNGGPPFASGAAVVALAGVAMSLAWANPAVADSCANAAFRSGASERLPDCRAYEQVSPEEKGGLDAATLQPVLAAQSSACDGGDSCAIAYMNIGAAFAGAPGNEFLNAYIAARSADGWQTTPLSPPTLQPPANSHPKVTYAFSDDLSQAVLRVPLQQLTADAPTGVYNLFVRQVAGGYSLVTAAPPALPPQAGCGSCFERQDVPVFAGASSDFSRVFFEANDSLVEGAPGGGVENLYEEHDGRVALTGVLPDGAIPAQGATAGGGLEVVNERTRQLHRAVSLDGSRSLFQAQADGGAPAPQQAGMTELYDRIDGSSTVEVSAPAVGAQPGACETREGVCAPRPAQFRAASADGSLVYFTSRAALTKDSYTGPEESSEGEEEGADSGGDLYRYDLATSTLTDLTVDASNPADPIGADVLGVLGSSADGSYVYFVATGQLAGGALSGQPNLYVWHGTAPGAGSVRFIATLAAPEEEEVENIEAMRAGTAFPYHSDIADWTSRPTEAQAYVTPDGRHMAFMSVKPLTGYDNEDQATGEVDHEVFEYSAESGALVCVSCDVSGARPLGSAFVGAKLGERASTPFYRPRSLSDDGSRVFFSSPDPLVPGLAGGTVKVFEYEDGAAQLLSGAGGGSDDVLLDASASGNDVFIATRARLTAGDTDELVDVYDARVEGGLPTPSAPASCQASACQEPFARPSSFPAPASASFVGPGNLTPRPPTKLTRKQLLARALARCQKLKQRKQRATCVAAAKRRYAPKATLRKHRPVPHRHPGSSK